MHPSHFRIADVLRESGRGNGLPDLTLGEWRQVTRTIGRTISHHGIVETRDGMSVVYKAEDN